LVVHLHAVGIFTIAPIVWADGRLNVSHIPGLRAQHAQRSGRVERACTHLLVIRLPDEAAVLSPIVLQSHDNGLEIEWRSHVNDFRVVVARVRAELRQEDYNRN